VFRAPALALVVALAVGWVGRSPAGASASEQKPPAASTAAAEPSKDTLGRDTPRGTLLGFIRAAQSGRDEVAVAYLDTKLRGQAAITLARQLHVVLDSRLPARLGDVSDRPEGALASPLKPDVDVVGTIQSASGPLEIRVERTKHAGDGAIWLFSRETLEAIPDIYDEIDLVRIDRHLPRAVTRIRIAGVRLFDWILLVVGIPVAFRLMGALGAVLGLLRRAVAARSARAGAAIPASLPGFVRLLVLAILIRRLLGGVDLPLIERQFWATAAAMFVIVAAAWALLVVNGRVEQYFQRRAAAPGELTAQLRLLRRMADIVVIAASVIVALKFFGVDPTAALAGLGIGGIAIALAAQKTLENVIGGLSIIFDRAVRVGDVLKLGETLGTVDYIGLRSTRIRTLDRTIVSVPNGQIANINIETLSSRDKFWFHHTVAVRYETSSRQLRGVMGGMRNRLLEHPAIDRESVRVRLFRLAPSSLDIELFAYVIAADWVPFLEIQEALLLDMMDIVERAGASIALPSQTVYFAGAHAGAPAAATTIPAFVRTESTRRP